MSATAQAAPKQKTKRKALYGRPFTKGKSGNPGGRPKAPELVEIRRLFRAEGPAAVERIAVLAGLRIKEGKPAAQSEAVQAVCLREILDRGYGRAPQSEDGAGSLGKRVIIRYEWADETPAALESPPITLDAEPAADADVVWNDAAD